MIPAKAVEAAQVAYIALRADKDYRTPDEYAAAILEAAAPHMLAEAWDDGSNSGYLWALKEGPWQEPDETAPTNPYKTETL